jgi:hypothetical protein
MHFWAIMETNIRTSTKHRACLPPYSQYKSKGPYRGNNGRLLINLLGNWEKDTRKTFLYARYLLAVHDAKLPDPGMDVDHIDNNAFNDTLANLQWLPHVENIKKSNRKPCQVQFKCPHCSLIFVVNKRNSHLSKRGQCATYCSRECAYYSRNYQDFVQEYTILTKTPPLKGSAIAFEEWEKFSLPITSKNIHNYCTNGKNTSLSDKGETRTCKACRQPFKVKHRNQTCCSFSCARTRTQPKKVSDAEVLEAVLLILKKESSWTTEGKKLGVSDSALRKRAKTLNLIL